LNAQYFKLTINCNNCILYYVYTVDGTDPHCLYLGRLPLPICQTVRFPGADATEDCRRLQIQSSEHSASSEKEIIVSSNTADLLHHALRPTTDRIAPPPRQRVTESSPAWPMGTNRSGPHPIADEDLLARARELEPCHGSISLYEHFPCAVKYNIVSPGFARRRQLPAPSSYTRTRTRRPHLAGAGAILTEKNQTSISLPTGISATRFSTAGACAICLLTRHMFLGWFQFSDRRSPRAGNGKVLPSAPDTADRQGSCSFNNIAALNRVWSAFAPVRGSGLQNLDWCSVFALHRAYAACVPLSAGVPDRHMPVTRNTARSRIDDSQFHTSRSPAPAALELLHMQNLCGNFEAALRPVQVLACALKISTTPLPETAALLYAAVVAELVSCARDIAEHQPESCLPVISGQSGRPAT